MKIVRVGINSTILIMISAVKRFLISFVSRKVVRVCHLFLLQLQQFLLLRVWCINIRSCLLDCDWFAQLNYKKMFLQTFKRHGSSAIIKSQTGIRASLQRWQPPPAQYDPQFGDYPKFPWVEHDKRDPNKRWDDPVHKRMFGETVIEYLNSNDVSTRPKLMNARV